MALTTVFPFLGILNDKNKETETYKEEYHMCGIVGYVGSGNAEDFLIDGLRRLEYRGYDSAGFF